MTATTNTLQYRVENNLPGQAVVIPAPRSRYSPRFPHYGGALANVSYTDCGQVICNIPEAWANKAARMLNDCATLEEQKAVMLTIRAKLDREISVRLMADKLTASGRRKAEGIVDRAIADGVEHWQIHNPMGRNGIYHQYV